MEIPFPAPDLVTGGRRYWSRSTIRRWRAEQASLPAPNPQADDETMLNSRQVRDLFGGVSHMWLARRLQRKTSTGKVAA